MNITALDKEIAKEICLNLISKGNFAIEHTLENDIVSYNKLVGKQVGELYNSILSTICSNNE